MEGSEKADSEKVGSEKAGRKKKQSEKKHLKTQAKQGLGLKKRVQTGKLLSGGYVRDGGAQAREALTRASEPRATEPTPEISRMAMELRRRTDEWLGEAAPLHKQLRVALWRCSVAAAGPEGFETGCSPAGELSIDSSQSKHDYSVSHLPRKMYAKPGFETLEIPIHPISEAPSTLSQEERDAGIKRHGYAFNVYYFWDDKAVEQEETSLLTGSAHSGAALEDSKGYRTSTVHIPELADLGWERLRCRMLPKEARPTFLEMLEVDGETLIGAGSEMGKWGEHHLAEEEASDEAGDTKWRWIGDGES
ncbi:hypothetical protein QBC36DRAFT_306939 [Triangularia setosa]|uniref:Uncharacterized protein n=1 Tax=Triangularia setosa TaxID=2587417 RepID=A0AAN6WHZ2_9PEZI|nr:hypothetical protein QBC36DRAFT_306939 [Podospora setosa]